MLDSPWLYPELALPLINEHDHCFASMNPPGRRLSAREMERFGKKIFSIGWQFVLKTPSTEEPAVLLLERNMPFSEPRIALLNDGYYLKWPHVEDLGFLCLRDGEAISHTCGLELSKHFINKAERLVEDNYQGALLNDFISEFNSYWRRWCRLKGSRNEVMLLSPPGPPSREIYFAAVNGQILACENILQGINWFKDRFPGKRILEKDFVKGLFLWLRDGFIPDDYPKTNSAVFKILQDQDKNTKQLLLSAAPKNPGRLNIVFGFESGNGPALGALCLNEPEKQIRPGKKVQFRFEGFRSKGNRIAVAAEKYFSTFGKTIPMSVQRVDRNWIFERGSKEMYTQLDEIRIGIIGCGSLGGQIAMHLAQSGIRKFLFIDPETLSFDNIGRHLLGGQFAKQYKVSALEGYLKAHFPGLMEINAKKGDWETVYQGPEGREAIESCDLLVSAIGHWDAESALSHRSIYRSKFPPVLFGWTEPYGFAGHALLVTGVGGCFSCGMDDFGKFQYTITDWPMDSVLKRAPACGDTFQPYGVLDVAQTQAMIARLCMEYVLGNVRQSQHWAWTGDIQDLQKSNGKLREGLSAYYGDIGEGNRVIKRNWCVSSKCQHGH